MRLDLATRRRIPQPLRRWLFKVYPGRWTQAEVDEINRRAREDHERLRGLIE